jgi:hypothetical protein
MPGGTETFYGPNVVVSNPNPFTVSWNQMIALTGFTSNQTGCSSAAIGSAAIGAPWGSWFTVVGDTGNMASPVNAYGNMTPGTIPANGTALVYGASEPLEIQFNSLGVDQNVRQGATITWQFSIS